MRERQFTDTALYTQLAFYEYLFDAEHHLKRLADADSAAGACARGRLAPRCALTASHGACPGLPSADVVKRARDALQPYETDLARVRAVPRRYLDRNARRFVNLATLFTTVKS